MKPASKKRISTQLRQLNKMLWVAFPLLSLPFYAQAENNTPFSDSSLTGIQKTYGPNVTLALSVEFPTAGAAYSTATKFTDAMMSQTFLGYFDNTKCYEYVAPNDRTGMLAFAANGYRQDSGSDNISKDSNGKLLLAPDGTQALAGKRRPWIVYYEGHRLNIPDSVRSNNMLYESIREKEFFLYDRINTDSYDSMGTSGAVNHKYETNEREYFRPTRTASTSNGMVGVCEGEKEFSGNFMNWATMSAIDIFRQAMTGGNRALGVAKDTTAYVAGDTPSRTFLRRANVVRAQNAHYMQRTVALSEENIKKVLPHDYAVDNPLLADRGKESPSNKFFLYKGYIPHPYAYRMRLDSREWKDETKPTHIKAMMGKVILATHRPLLVRNSGFGVDFRRAVYDASHGGWYQNAFSRDICALNPRIGGVTTQIGDINDGQNGRYWAPVKSRVMPYQVTVEACVPDKLEANCVRQPSGSYKPEGLMQQNASTMRFAAFGYANIAGNTVSGGVLRSRMRYIANPNRDGATATGPAVKYQEEIDPKTGQFYVNPDRNAEETAAQAFVVNTGDKNLPSSNFDNSGTINYLNKFGDYNNYKTNDPGAELYYTALRYLRNKGFPALYKTKLAEVAGS
ncbi:hypothetical protein [Kingella kingae]|uniref:hypothetical protein n=2 Tax=Kingella kingae TaxID=504 RepID=UPI0003F8F5A8|nr:hypothetical protein [Kingella kingae]